MSEPERFDLEETQSVLVIKPSSLGDVIHTLPAVARLHRARPDLEIDWVVNAEWAPLLEGNPALRRVIPMPRREWRGWRDLPKAKRWAREALGSLQPDLVLDFQGLLRSALLARASKGRYRVGFREAREGASLFYDQKIEIPDWKNTHAVDRYLALVEALGIEGEQDEDPSKAFPLPEGSPVSGLEGIEAGFLLLHPFSRGRGKSMAFTEVIELCRHLETIRPGTPVVLVGAGLNWPESIEMPEQVIDLLDRTSLAQLIWLMRHARFVVSVDSGPMHLAAAITGDLLSLHTWTNPRMVGPWRKDAWAWRDGECLRVGDIAPGRFPERRDDRDRYADGILASGQGETLVRFMAERMGNEEGA